MGKLSGEGIKSSFLEKFFCRKGKNFFKTVYIPFVLCYNVGGGNWQSFVEKTSSAKKRKKFIKL